MCVCVCVCLCVCLCLCLCVSVHFFPSESLSWRFGFAGFVCLGFMCCLQASLVRRLVVFARVRLERVPACFAVVVHIDFFCNFVVWQTKIVHTNAKHEAQASALGERGKRAAKAEARKGGMGKKDEGRWLRYTRRAGCSLSSRGKMACFTWYFRSDADRIGKGICHRRRPKTSWMRWKSVGCGAAAYRSLRTRALASF